MSRSRLPLQPRNPNTYSTASSSSGEESRHLSTLESSNNDNNKARVMTSNLSLRKSSSNLGAYAVELGNEHNSSLVTNAGAYSSQSVLKRQGSSTSSIGGTSRSDLQRSSAQLHQEDGPSPPQIHPKVPGPPRIPDTGDNVLIEEKRKRINGEGYTVHQYIRGSMLGKGGFAKVYLCTALDTNKQYAVKIVPKANLVKTRARQKLQAEIKIHRTLKHRNVCEYKHFFEDRNNCYILLELCHNQSVNELIKRRKRLTEPESAYFMNQLIDAVEYMHDQCVIHRDLKLGNLFLDKDLNIKVGDLGLATRLANAEEKRKTICGTPNYIAPEVIQGSRETRGHSFEVDIWSMGVILFTLLVGKPPYEAQDVKATYQRIIANEYKFPSHVTVSDSARDLITSMLQSNPEDRPTLNEMRQHPFFQVQIPVSLPLSVLHVAPEWVINDYGELEVMTERGKDETLRSSHAKASSWGSARHPLAGKDVNSADKATDLAKVTNREQEVREAVQERVRSALSGKSTSVATPTVAQFEIYDETKDRKSKPRTPKSVFSNAVDEILERASALTLSDRKSDSGTPKPEAAIQSPTEDTEILHQMLESLTTALDIAETRKYSYNQANPARPTSRGGPSVWVARYVDYTSKYGLGFLLNDGCSGVYFNDSTKAVLEFMGDSFQYVERRKVDSPDGAARKNEPVCEHHTLSTYPESLQKKVTLLKHFRNYLIEQQKKAPDDEGSPVSAVNSVATTVPMTYLKKWVRTKHAILFRLSNQTIQIVFYDQTEVLLTPDQRFVTYVDKKRTRSTFYLNDELVGTNPEMAKRLKYSKEILNQLLNGQQQKR